MRQVWCEKIWRDRITFTTNVNLYHLTSRCFPFTCRLQFIRSTIKLLVSRHFHPQELACTVLIRSVPTLRNRQFDVCRLP